MIGTQDYRVYADAIADAHESGTPALGAISTAQAFKSRMEINSLDANSQSLDAFMSSTYSLVYFKHLGYQRPLGDSVRALNDHVLRTYGGANIDAFLDNQYLEAPLTFVEIANSVGYNITRIGTKAARWQDVDDNWEDIDHLNWERIGWTNVC